MVVARAHRQNLNQNGAVRRARSADTRAAILSAAANVFAESGLAGARTDAIADAAHVNKAMLYYYFKSKDQLHEAVVEDHFAEFNRQALEVLNGPGSARDFLLRYVNLHFDFISARHRYACLYQQLMMAGGKPLERLVQRYFTPRGEAFDRLLARGMRSGEFRRAELRHTAISIIALIVFYFSAGQVLQLFMKEDIYSEANLKKRKKEVLEFIRHGLFVDPNLPAK
jgi:TetR/AcrR family transcriptional regulator